MVKFCTIVCCQTLLLFLLFQAPNMFDDEMVMRQLRYTGMLETVRIRQAGFNVRLSYEEFIHHYRILLPKALLRYYFYENDFHWIGDWRNILIILWWSSTVFIVVSNTFICPSILRDVAQMHWGSWYFIWNVFHVFWCVYDIKNPHTLK